MKKERLDIFDTMAAIDKHDMGFLDRQSEDLRKSFVPTVTLRWASAVTGPEAETYLICINEFANRDFHDLRDFPDLQYRLLAMTGCGRPQKHQWIPVAKQGRSSTHLQEFVGRYHRLASIAEIDMLIDMFTTDTFQRFVNESGCSPEEAKEIMGVYGKTKKAN